MAAKSSPPSLAKSITNAKALQKAVRRTPGKQVRSPTLQAEIRAFVEGYFKVIRPAHIANGSAVEVFAGIDATMQSLLRCMQGHPAKTTCISFLKYVIHELGEADMILLTGTATSGPILTDRERRILHTLRTACPPAAQAFDQALTDLGSSTRKSWRGVAAEFREALRETLDKMAPDDSMLSQPGFKGESKDGKPSMAQKAAFILKARDAHTNVTKSLRHSVTIVEETVGAYVRSTYDASSAAAHTESSRTDALRVRDFVTLALAELLEIR